MEQSDKNLLNCDNIELNRRSIHEYTFEETIPEENNPNTQCGAIGWYPKWLQKLASKKTYVFVYSLLGMYESMISSYLGGCITTIEKRFKLPSTVLGIIGSGWDTGSMLTSLIFAYIGSGGYKTKWIASGALAMALACYVRFIPHLIYGPGDEAEFHSSDSSAIDNLCNDVSNVTENCDLNTEGRNSAIILYIGQIMTGIGTSAYFTLGATYLDDNVVKRKFPFLQGLVMFIRLFGPTIGLMISSYVLSIYINFGKKPPFSNHDPRWLGAWYLALIPFGCIGIIISLCLSLFPRVLPREAERRRKRQEEALISREISFKDFKETMIRLLKNPILMLNSFSTVFFAIGGMGFWTFLPKYFEYQFRKSASEANFIAGSIGLICTAFGVITSGIVMSVFRPRPSYVAGWNVITEIYQTGAFIALAFLGCFRDDMVGSFNENGEFITTMSCNENCGCYASMSYSPVCSKDQSMTFFSPCHAGCTTTTFINETKIFGNCSCIDDGFGIATEGPCPVSCTTDFILFVFLICTSEFLISTGKAGNTIIQYR
ncbi:hypothetical protein O3M35_003347 [Rhynocoris fuscipes]